MTFLHQYPVAFYQCNFCGLMQTAEHFWLDEAYGQAISALDTGVLLRNLYLMKIVSVFLRFSRDRHGIFLDYGGGHGLFTRLMRDHGYDFRWEDRYADNIYAAGFEYERSVPLSGITAFEVLEHLDNPGDFFADILGDLRPGLFMATTEIFVEPANQKWHYIYPESGQHITFYQERTLRFIARKYGYSYFQSRGFHVFSLFPVAGLWLRFVIRFAKVIYPLLKFESLQAQDQKKMKVLL
jgi:hypothetical protein